MKTLGIVLFSLALAVTGCMSSSQISGTYGRVKQRYPEEALALRLVQDDQTADLILTLTNQSSQPITNFFPQTVFEGSVWVLQDGLVPLQTYPSNYFELLIKALWFNPEKVIPPSGFLTYRIPIESLICPFSSREPHATRPVFAYAFFDGLEAVSNVIPLKDSEKIQWRSKLVRQRGDSLYGL